MTSIKKFMDKQPHSYTMTEIFGQPDLWTSVYKLFLKEEENLKRFLDPILNIDKLQIILTGAGSSAFIGEAAEGLVQKYTGQYTKAIATTDIVTHPELFFHRDRPILLISFARSGNSPESLETVELANNFCAQVYNLVITCNNEGELLKFVTKNSHKSYALLLPEASNDKSLAMTGSFTSMLLSVLLLSDIKNLREKEKEISVISQQGRLLLQKSDAFAEIAKINFERVVFLGSGPMLGIARECHLKLQELTDGQVICKFDSFLGFRHGPRAVTNSKTLLVYLFSPDDFVYKYELDLALSISKDTRNIKSLSIGRAENKRLNTCLNVDLHMHPDQQLNIIPAGLVGQLLGYYKSLELGLNPDNPSVSGAISRVVQGVTIYNYEKILR